ncbi:hypothetical protein C8Q74DRAFT_1026668 [Fomes fomentarius]|nr:hypothetical protein C8Q74DRAFT_1026668 [Fomes fomentarius]
MAGRSPSLIPATSYHSAASATHLRYSLFVSIGVPTPALQADTVSDQARKIHHPGLPTHDSGVLLRSQYFDSGSGLRPHPTSEQTLSVMFHLFASASTTRCIVHPCPHRRRRNAPLSTSPCAPWPEYSLRATGATVQTSTPKGNDEQPFPQAASHRPSTSNGTSSLVQATRAKYRTDAHGCPSALVCATQLGGTYLDFEFHIVPSTSHSTTSPSDGRRRKHLSGHVLPPLNVGVRTRIRVYVMLVICGPVLIH